LALIVTDYTFLPIDYHTAKAASYTTSRRPTITQEPCTRISLRVIRAQVADERSGLHAYCTHEAVQSVIEGTAAEHSAHQPSAASHCKRYVHICMRCPPAPWAI